MVLRKQKKRLLINHHQEKKTRYVGLSHPTHTHAQNWDCNRIDPSASSPLLGVASHSIAHQHMWWWPIHLAGRIDFLPNPRTPTRHWESMKSRAWSVAVVVLWLRKAPGGGYSRLSFGLTWSLSRMVASWQIENKNDVTPGRRSSRACQARLAGHTDGEEGTEAWKCCVMHFLHRLHF